MEALFEQEHLRDHQYIKYIKTEFQCESEKITENFLIQQQKNQVRT